MKKKSSGRPAARRRPTLRHAKEIDALLAAVHPEEGPAHRYVRELVATSLSLVDEETSLGDVKLINAATRELRYALRVFASYRGVPKVTAFGSARTPPGHPAYEQAKTFARRIVEEGFMVITGAGPGIMQACNEGATRDQSFGLNIRLPFEQSSNEFIAGDPKLVTFRYFFTRKLMFLKESAAIALFPGGFGTFDETYECLTLIQTGKAPLIPVVMVDPPGGGFWADWRESVAARLVADGLISEEDLRLFRITDDAEDAVSEIVRFYRVFHSSRFVGDRLVLRLKSAPDARTLEEIRSGFADIRLGDDFSLSSRLPEEEDEDDTGSLPRLVFGFDRAHYGRLRELVDLLNDRAE